MRAFVSACLRDLSMSTRATRNNDSLIPPFRQTPRDGCRFDELTDSASYIINRLVCSERAAPLRERDTLSASSDRSPCADAVTWSLYIADSDSRSRSADLYIKVDKDFRRAHLLGSLSIPSSLPLLGYRGNWRYASLICLRTYAMYFNKAQVGIISQSVAQLLLHKLEVSFDRYRRWTASQLLISIADTGNRFDLGNETGRYGDILISWQVRKVHANAALFAKRWWSRVVFFLESEIPKEH